MLDRLQKKYSDWDYIHPHLLWGGIFAACFVIALLITIVTTISTPPSFIISNESARSFISTSNQIQATILAIVVSLTLLAVEMTASKYSPRVIEIFKRSAALWIFLFSYSLSISIGSIFLTIIDIPDLPISTTLGTLFLLALGIFLILMLIPYVLSTLEFLNTERIVKRLADLINTDTISPQVDPFQSVFDVIYGAIKINDFTTMSTGLTCAEERFKEIIANGPANWQDDYIIFRFFDDMKRCGFSLIEKKEDKYAFEIINRLKTINEWAFTEQKTLVLHRSCPAIEEIAVKACEYGMISVIDHSFTTLKEIAESVERIEGLAQNDEVTRKWSCTLFSIVESISNIGKASIKYDLDSSSQKAIEILDKLGRYAIKKSLTFEDDFVFKRIGEVTLEYVNRDKITLVNSSVQTLQFLGGYSVDHNHSKEAQWVLEELKKIGKKAAHQKKAEMVRRVVNAMRYITINATEKQGTDVQRSAFDMILKFKLLYPAFFKGETAIQLFDYEFRDTITVSKEEYDIALLGESYKLDEYLRPPDDWEGAYDDDDDTMVLSL